MGFFLTYYNVIDPYFLFKFLIFYYSSYQLLKYIKRRLENGLTVAITLNVK